MSEYRKCRECSGENLVLAQCNSNKTGVAEGRLRTHEVTCSFVLGCEDCSETITVIGADKFISNYDSAQSELSALREERGRLDATLSCMNGHVLAYKLSRQRLLARARARELHISDLEKRMTDAEQRNAELGRLAEIAIPCLRKDVHPSLATMLEAAIKPAESGVSENKCCERFPKCVCNEGADGL